MARRSNTLTVRWASQSPRRIPFAGFNHLCIFGVLVARRRGAVKHKILRERRMKVIRIAALAFALCAGLASVAPARGHPEPQGQGEMRRGGGMGGTLLKDITLTDAQ